MQRKYILLYISLQSLLFSGYVMLLLEVFQKFCTTSIYIYDPKCLLPGQCSLLVFGELTAFIIKLKGLSPHPRSWRKSRTFPEYFTYIHGQIESPHHLPLTLPSHFLQLLSPVYTTWPLLFYSSKQDINEDYKIGCVNIIKISGRTEKDHGKGGSGNNFKLNLITTVLRISLTTSQSLILVTTFLFPSNAHLLPGCYLLSLYSTFSHSQNPTSPTHQGKI